MEISKDELIYVAGHNGLVGSGVIRELKAQGYKNLIVRSSRELDLTDQGATESFFREFKPSYVIDCAAKVGGIKANMTYPAEFLYTNLQIQNNLIWSSNNNGVKKFLFLGSSCIYPRDCPQPMREDYFMTGKPEPTNEAYAYAKIAGMKLCEFVYSEFGKNFVSCMPTNIYGENDNFDPETSHVIPALIRRIHEAKENNTSEVVIWGTGESRREFLYVDDLANAIVFLLEHYNEKEFINVGTGTEVSIRELAETIKSTVGYEGDLVFDASAPDGMPRKLLDVSKINELGWKYTIDLAEGLDKTYKYFLENKV